jgi:hypothetical protein
MESYSNRNSGVESFDIGGDYIKVKFKNTQKKIYIYSYEQAGALIM